jgi:hypothetical protein
MFYGCRRRAGADPRPGRQERARLARSTGRPGDGNRNSVDLSRAAVDVDRNSVDLCSAAVDISRISVDLCRAAVDIDRISVDICSAAVDIDRISVDICSAAVDIDRFRKGAYEDSGNNDDRSGKAKSWSVSKIDTPGSPAAIRCQRDSRRTAMLARNLWARPERETITATHPEVDPFSARSSLTLRLPRSRWRAVFGPGAAGSRRPGPRSSCARS